MCVCSVAKDSSNPLVLKLTLHSLVSCWEPDVNCITDDDITDAPTRPSVVHLIGYDRELMLCSNCSLFSRSS